MGNIFHRENEIMLTVIQFFIYVISYYYIFDIDDLRKGGETIPQFVFEGEGESLYPPKGVLPYISYSIRVCLAGKGMVLKPFTLGYGLVIIENWFSIGSHLTNDSP